MSACFRNTCVHLLDCESSKIDKYKADNGHLVKGLRLKFTKIHKKILQRSLNWGGLLYDCRSSNTESLNNCDNFSYGL